MRFRVYIVFDIHAKSTCLEMINSRWLHVQPGVSFHGNVQSIQVLYLDSLNHFD